MNRLPSVDIKKHLELSDRFRAYLDAENASINIRISVDDVTVHPTAQAAVFRIKLSGDPRDTVIGSYGTRNGIGTNAGSHYTKTEGNFIFQPGDPTEKEVIVPLRGNNVVGSTVELVFSNTVYGASYLTPNVRRVRFSDVAPVVANRWSLVYETDFVTDFEFSDSATNAAGEPCWSTRLAHGRTQPNNAELGLYADPIIIPGTNPFPIVDGRRHLRSEKLTNTWQGKTYNYTAAVLRSNSIQRVTDGMKVEARFACPQMPCRGAWPAFWLLPTDGSWPPEIDVLEWAVDANASPWRMNTTQHWFEINGNRTRPYAADLRNFGITTPVTDFHTWGIELTERELYFTVDGVRFITMEHRSPGKTWYVLLNLAMGGNWPGAPTADTQFPVDMTLDWIRFYEPA